MLVVRVGHFPVQSVASLAVTLTDGTVVTLDATRAQIGASGRMIEASVMVAGGAQPGLSPDGAPLSRWRRQWVSVTYTGGIAVGAVPYDVQQACVWVASEFLAQRRNPTGAAFVKQGKFEISARPRGDTSGDSILLLQAKAALEAYRVR